MATFNKSILLNDGNKIPLIAYGTGTSWSKGETTIKQVNRALVDSIKKAIALGYRHIDTAEYYGTELEVGIAIQESGVPRADLYITSKNLNFMTDIPKALDNSLRELQLDYLDLYLIHSPFFARDLIELQSVWRLFEKLKVDGKVRSIGVSNFSINHLTAILDIATIKPAVNQIEMHPYLQQKEMRDFANKHGIQVTAYGPLAPLSKVPGGPVDDVVLRLAGKYRVSEGTVFLKWATQNGVTVVTTSRNQSRLEEYIHMEEWQLEGSDLNDIDEAGRMRHFRGFFTKELEGP